MSWNGSNNGGAVKSAPVKKPSAKSSGLTHGLIAGGAVVLIGIIALYFVGGENGEPQIEKKGSASIAEVDPEVVTNDVAESSADVNEAEKREKIPTYRDERGILRYKGGQRAYDPERPKKVVKMNEDADGNKLYKTSVFTRNRAEHEIERLITAEPGATMIGMRRYDAQFEAQFKQSLEMPILVEKDDDERTVAIKKAMIEVKTEICDRMRAGEKLADILDDARSELQRLAQYKRYTEKLVRETTEDVTLTDQDVDDVVSAANKMLEEKGIAPIKGTAVLRRNIMLRKKAGVQ